jgi:hypothetical protein
MEQIKNCLFLGFLIILFNNCSSSDKKNLSEDLVFQEYYGDNRDSILRKITVIKRDSTRIDIVRFNIGGDTVQIDKYESGPLPKWVGLRRFIANPLYSRYEFVKFSISKIEIGNVIVERASDFGVGVDSLFRLHDVRIYERMDSHSPYKDIERKGF